MARRLSEGFVSLSQQDWLRRLLTGGGFVKLGQHTGDGGFVKLSQHTGDEGVLGLRRHTGSGGFVGVSRQEGHDDVGGLSQHTGAGGFVRLSQEPSAAGFVPLGQPDGLRPGQHEARGQWRITPVPPYVPNAAVLPDSLWPELPARPAAAPVPAYPTLAMLRRERLQAEQGAT